MIDVEGAGAHPEPRPYRSPRGHRLRRRPGLALLVGASMSLLFVVASSTPGQADTISSLQAKAAELQQQIQSADNQISALGQRYDQAKDELASIDSEIATTKDKIATDQARVAADESHLRSAALDAYMSEGSVGQVNLLFSDDQKTFAAEQEYGQVASGNLDVDLANLHTAQVALSAEQSELVTQEGAAEAAVNSAAAAQAQAGQQQGLLEAALSQVKGEVGTLERQQQEAADAAQNADTQQLLASAANFPPPPSAGGAAGVAVSAAESQLGVPYVWGGTSPRGTPGDPSGGFDCSGLVMWAWGQAGVGLPHFSGAQFDDTAPVPVADMEPGDILFYGPDGDTHEAMYIGGGEMIEAPETGEVVWITPIRLGDGFSGVRRP